ncbi:7094_t:CDS:2, partial [Dentiscutata erythropus]
MASNSNDSHVEIPIVESPDTNKNIFETPDENKEILEIVCSPNLKHVAALDEDNNISLWPVSQEQLLMKIRTNKNGEKIFAVSDYKYVSISHERVNPYNFKHMFFTSKDNISWVCKSMIELKYFKKIYITLKSKLIIFNDTIHEITMWDIDDLSIKARILIDWNYTPESIEISDDEGLLLVRAKNEKTEESRLYVFSAENGINLVSSAQCNLIDPYNIDDYSINDHNTNGLIDASKLFERIEVKQNQKPHIL